MTGTDDTARIREQYDAYAPRYDQETAAYERLMLSDGRSWACGQARGRVLEVAIGTGRNLPYYPREIRLVGVELSAAMVRRARARIEGGATAGHPPTVLLRADAEQLPLADESFDTVVCTLGLSSIPDHRAAIREIYRVLRPDGRLITLGHVMARNPLARRLQRVIEWVGALRVDDSQSREVSEPVRAAGLRVVERRLSRGGIIERLIAVKPKPPVAIWGFPRRIRNGNPQTTT